MGENVKDDVKMKTDDWSANIKSLKRVFNKDLNCKEQLKKQ